MSHDRISVRDKLMYLAELQRLFSIESSAAIRGDVANRMQMVCNSIEKDLGLKSSSVGDLNVKVNVDTPALQEAIKEAAPALVFVSEKGGRHAKVYQDGIQLKGVKSITIRAAVDEPTTHEIEYVTGYTAEKGEA